MNLNNYSKITGWLVGWCAKRSLRPKAVIINSESGKLSHIDIGYHPREWTVIPNGFDLDKFRYDVGCSNRFKQELQLSEDLVLVGLVARYDPMKDHRCFILAANHLIKNMKLGNHVRFVLVGKGINTDNKYIMSMITDLDLEDYFYLLGERQDIPAIMSALDIYCSTSAYGEGFPNVIGEAMACSIPCVVTDVGDSSLVIGDTGKIIPPGDHKLFAEALGDLIRLEKSERQRIGDQARKRIESLYSIEKITKQYEFVYHHILYT